MNKIITCEECGIDYYSETIVPRQSFRHVFPDIVKLEAELADKEKQLAGAQELIKKLRRCANCKHKVEYVRFGEVATACALDVNEEENQTCKNFDKWESEQ